MAPARPAIPASLHRALSRVLPLVLPIWFTVGSLSKLLTFWERGLLGIDFFIYRAAADAAVHGGNPWTTSVSGFVFAGPPPTLAAYIPLALLPEWIALLVSVTILAGAAVALIRLLKLPWWWLLFPPTFESLLAQNPDILVTALLVAGGAWAAFAPLLKIYAVLPLLLQVRWRPLVGAAVVMLLGLPFLPTFLDQAGSVQAVLQAQAMGGQSAWGTWLAIPTALALVSLGRESASWLIVPALWPSTQPHYASLALPAVKDRPFLAGAMSIPIPLVGPIAIMVTAVWERWIRDRVHARSGQNRQEDRSVRVLEEDSPPGGR